MLRPYLKLPSLTEQALHRFWSKVHKDQPDTCWLWMNRRDKDGYGVFRHGPHKFHAHRIAFGLHSGDPGNLMVLHRCDNPPCCNPQHLFKGTLQDNNRDMLLKGRKRIFYGSDNPLTKYSESVCAQIRVLRKNGYIFREIAEMTGVSKEQCRRIAIGQSRIS